MLFLHNKLVSSQAYYCHTKYRSFLPITAAKILSLATYAKNFMICSQQKITQK